MCYGALAVDKGGQVTIAGVYLTPEGIVMGADSTTTANGSTGWHFFNHAQKVFEIGENSTLAAITWGLAGLGATSYRTLLARLADDLTAKPATSVVDAAQRWADLFWAEYSAFSYVQRAQALHGMTTRTPEEEQEFLDIKDQLVVGFCIGGHTLPDRVTEAFEVVFDPLSGKPTPVQVLPLSHRWWGVPNIIKRLIDGADDNLVNDILNSPHWQGSDQDLYAIVKNQTLMFPILPIRDAVDFVHTCIRSTGKAMRFTDFPQVCGGTPEVAVITSDRKFRWVTHKAWDTAIADGG